ncbi:thiamine-phosphate kinase [bacterium]|nr:thiamine-phosphate kinase [bacterium]
MLRKKPIKALVETGHDTVADWGEFGFIDNLRRRLPQASGALQLGVGDDAAWWRPALGNGVLTTTDMLVAGVHFDLAYTSAADLGHKALAVNLSDLAAMGSKPACAYLGLALPAHLKKAWLDEFIGAFLLLAKAHDLQLAGGDTVAAKELVISVTLNGLAPESEPLLRSGAALDDDIYVSGTIGDSFLGLQLLQKRLKSPTGNLTEVSFLQERHLRPVPRVELGEQLAASGVVSAMLDISDGVIADLGHLLTASGGLGAELDCQKIPLSEAGCQFVEAGLVSFSSLLAGGEDYELLFTAPQKAHDEIAEIASESRVALTKIGQINHQDTITIFENGIFKELKGRGGYDHFQN